VAAQIIAHGKAQHAFLGLSAVALTQQLKQLFNLPTATGLLVQHVTPRTAASKVGIKPGTTSVVVGGESYLVGGDIITKIDGKPVSTTQQLFYTVLQKQPGDRMKIELWHHGSKRTVTVKLGSRT